MRIKDIIDKFITTRTIVSTPYQRMQKLRDPNRVKIRLLRSRKDYHGVERIWQISCTLPALSQENYGLLLTGVEAMAARLRHILGLSLCGDITLGKSWVDRLDTGEYFLGTTVTQYELANAPSKEP